MRTTVQPEMPVKAKKHTRRDRRPPVPQARTTSIFVDRRHQSR